MTIFSVPAGDDLRINKEAIETTQLASECLDHMLPCLILLEWVSFANEMMLILSLDYSKIYNQPTTSLILVHGEEKASKE